MKDPWEDQLDGCLDKAYEFSRPWAKGVREDIREDRTYTFKKKQHDFPDHKHEVLKGAEIAGVVARAVANHRKDGDDVTVEDMQAGIAAAHVVCKARLPGVLLFWCE
jgi:hypothetical protein